MLAINFIGDIAFFPKNFLQQINLFNLENYSISFNADLNVGNLEFPFSIKKVKNYDSSFLGYLAPIEAIEILKSFGFDLLSLANNHIMDWGVEGLETTQKQLATIGIKSLGAGNNDVDARKPVIIEKNGIKIGFLAYSKYGMFSATKKRPGAACLEKTQIKKDIFSLKKSVDHVIVTLHWGVEFSDYPYPPDIKTAHEIIDAGTSCIIGHHPHTVQGIEVYKGCPIFYSLGSFIYNSWGERVFVDKKLWERCHSIVATILFEKDNVVDWYWLPFKSERHTFWPLPLNEEDANIFKQHFNIISKRIPFAAKWFYKEAAGNLFKRELITIFKHTKKTYGLFLLKKLFKIRLRHIKILGGFLINKLKSIIYSTRLC